MPAPYPRRDWQQRTDRAVGRMRGGRSTMPGLRPVAGNPTAATGASDHFSLDLANGRKVDQWSVTSTAYSTFTLTYEPVADSWNASCSWPLSDGAEFSISGQTLTIVSPATTFIGASSTYPKTLRIQYDHDNSAETSYPAAVRATSPRFYYRLDEPSGTSIADSSGNGRTGTLTGGATYSQTSCLTNDPDPSMTIAVGNYIAVPETAGDRSSSFTIEWWETLGGGGQREIFWYPGRLILVVSGGQGDLLYYPGGVLTRIDNTDAGFAGGPSATYHVVTYDGTTVTWYKNGTAYRTASTSVTLPTPTGADIHVGPTTGNAEITRFDEFAYYDHALTAAQVTAHWNAR